VTQAFAVGEQRLHNPVGVDDGSVKQTKKKEVASCDRP